MCEINVERNQARSKSKKWMVVISEDMRAYGVNMNMVRDKEVWKKRMN